MRAYLRNQWTRYFYTSEVLFDKIFDDDIKGVRSFITYLQKHDPQKLHAILEATGESGETVLSCAFSPIVNEYGYQIAMCLLDAGAKPYAKLTKRLEGESIIYDLVRGRNLCGTRLLIWYDPDGYLDIVNPREGKSVRENLDIWNDRAEPWLAPLIEGRDPVNVREYVESSTILARRRFEYLKVVERERAANNYAEQVDIYLKLNKTCQLYADIENEIPYHRIHHSLRHYQVQHYKNQGQNYLKTALQVCQQWLLSFDDPATLNREQVTSYRKVLDQALALCQELKQPKLERHYQRLLAGLPVVELSPTTAAVSCMPEDPIEANRSSRALTTRSFFAEASTMTNLAAAEASEDPKSELGFVA